MPRRLAAETELPPVCRQGAITGRQRNCASHIMRDGEERTAAPLILTLISPDFAAVALSPSMPTRCPLSRLIPLYIPPRLEGREVVI
uniref:Uncharacterized protein n=1 Tax=Knipowitschia caucasica TaxID=637954 RepID=A0AAV2KFQ9_KNICA